MSEKILLRHEEGSHPFILFIDDTPNLTVNFPGSLLAILSTRLRLSGLEKERVAIPIEADPPEFFTHPVHFDHAFGNICGLEEVILRTGRDFLENDFLGHASA